PVHITTGRRLREDVAAGQTNLCVMLTGTLDLAGLDDWSIWWGANLGTDSEELVAGRVAEVLPWPEEARARAKAAAGWVMGGQLLRAREAQPSAVCSSAGRPRTPASRSSPPACAASSRDVA